MREKVYLGDWLFNAGVIGFLKIISGDTDIEKQNEITIGENYIEFERESLKGFSEKFFKTAFDQYGRYERVKKAFEGFRDDVDAIVKDDVDLLQFAKKYRTDNKDKNKIKGLVLDEITERYRSRITSGFTLLKNKSDKLPAKTDVKKDVSVLQDSLKKSLDILEKDYHDFLQSDVQIYLRKLYGQKSFLNKTVTANQLLKFKGDFENVLSESKNPVDKNLYCSICERKAKKDLNFNTGFAIFLGFNEDALNFTWNFNPKIPICEICELIYFCSFAGFTDVSRGEDKIFYFVNNDSSIISLMKSNRLLKQVLDKNMTENILVDFFTELILQAQEQKAGFTLQHIPFIEIDLTKEIFPKIYSLNISRKKAEFVQQNHDMLKKLSRTSYKIKDVTRFLLTETIEQFLLNNLGFGYMYKLVKIYMAFQDKNKKKKDDYYQAWYNPYHLQILTILVSLFIRQILKGGGKMDIEKTLWGVYYRGNELSSVLRKKEAENKIPTIAYKLLNALRIGDTNNFMDVIIRTYMPYELEIPAVFVKGIADKETFYAFGYSFINGLLGKKEENKNE